MTGPSLAEIKSAGVRIDGVTACRWVYGVGESKARQLLRKPEELDFKVIRVPGPRNRYVVSTAELLRLLELEDA